MTRLKELDIGEPCKLKYEDRECRTCSKKLQIRVVGPDSDNHKSLMYYCERHTFHSWCNPINYDMGQTSSTTNATNVLMNRKDQTADNFDVKKTTMLKKNLKQIYKELDLVLTILRILTVLVVVVLFLVVMGLFK